MKKYEQPQPNNKENTKIKESILANSAFIRFADGFKLYQNLLHDENSENAKNTLTGRMTELYNSRLNGTDEDAQHYTAKRELNKIINSILQDCQENNFSENSLAEKITSSSIVNLFLAEWNRQENEVEEGSGMIHVNDIIAYKEGENEISLHIRPTDVKSSELIFKIRDGFKTIGAKLAAGEIKADKIVMKSWLLNKKMEKKAKLLLGDKISIQDTSSDDNDVAAIQLLALQYNNKSLENYLKTGEKPEVRQVIMTKEEFIAKFKN